MITCKNVSVTIGHARLLKEVGFTVEEGQWLGVIGPNGAGKSTLLRILAGRQQHAGVVEIGGESVLSRRARSHMIAYLEQTPTVPEGMFVADYVMLGRTPHLSPFGSERDLDHQIVSEVLDRLDLTNMAGRRLDTLSGGERRRLEICRALASDPSILLLDEPFAGVDPIAVEEIQELIQKLRQKDIGILITDHNVRETLQSTDRAYIIHEGRILREGTANELIGDPKVREVYLGKSFEPALRGVTAEEEAGLAEM